MIGVGLHSIEDDLAEIDLGELDGLLNREFLLELVELNRLLAKYAEFDRLFPETG